MPSASLFTGGRIPRAPWVAHFVRSVSAPTQANGSCLRLSRTLPRPLLGRGVPFFDSAASLCKQSSAEFFFIEERQPTPAASLSDGEGPPQAPPRSKLRLLSAPTHPLPSAGNRQPRFFFIEERQPTPAASLSTGGSFPQTSSRSKLHPLGASTHPLPSAAPFQISRNLIRAQIEMCG
jgi:hypothetical protein